MRFRTVIATLAALTVAACGNSSTDEPAKTTTGNAPASSAASATVAAPMPAPTVISLTLSMAQDQNKDIDFAATDVSGDTVPARRGEPARGIFDDGNWQIVAQCDNVVDGELKVGVVKRDEFAQVEDGRMVSENGYSTLLDC
ncbi:hypothetical protein QM787_04195 [Rhodococcus ruber]|nr:hypothetical protein [Rhodococcus ruber]MCD2127701.1 hypothetical protein [Rhodococcus ruber]MCZ4504359.1 hypothetical protein [Rhodococcus ruber]MCZ4529405.1 hypothetical protein [Rhodococcus ruber]MCZ4621020.1 hypothetical protein [Rhodococcus ruber]MDI9967044.1 hypothetical protein [Rhodococcus ruber]